ncbi:hypothetical protein B0A55_11695, partial [Friedmanniomyces simplex]
MSDRGDSASMEEATRVFSVFTNPAETTSTVIIGAGIIGCATAYYLSRSGNTKPDTIHLVEASPELFASASGKAAGFLASDWFGPPTASLGALSFRLHKELADTIKLPISHLAGHSIVVKSPRWSREHETGGCHAVFTTMKSGFSPEVFSRIGGEIYVAGLNDPALPLPETATDAQIDQKSIEELKATAQKLLGRDGTDVSDLEVMREGLCFRPVTKMGSPVMTRIPDEELGAGLVTAVSPDGGVFVAAGHGPWGISQSLGTGKVMAEMMEGRE